MSDSPVTGSTTAKRRHAAVSMTFAVTSAVLIGVLFYGLKFIDQKRIPAVNVDKPALAFDVGVIQGKNFLPSDVEDRIRLADLQGKPVILNFWASWCVSCREEAHELEAFWQKHGKEVVVLGIAIQDEAEAAKKFAAYFRKTYPLGLDQDGKATIDYGVAGVPETFLIDRNGVIRHKETGPVTMASLELLLPKIQ